MTNKEMMLAALKDSGHFIDRENNVVYVSPKFNHEAEKFDTDECKTLDAVMKRFPKMTIREYVPKRKARLTFQAMEKCSFARCPTQKRTMMSSCGCARRPLRLTAIPIRPYVIGLRRSTPIMANPSCITMREGRCGTLWKHPALRRKNRPGGRLRMNAT